MILPVTLAVWIGLVGSVFTGARRLFRTITLSYCCRVTPVLTVHFVHRSCIVLVVLDSVVISFTRRPCPADTLIVSRCVVTQMSHVQFPTPAVSYIPLHSVAVLCCTEFVSSDLFRLTPDLICVTHCLVLRLSVVVRVSTPASGTPAEIQVEHEASRVCEQVQSRTPELSPTT